MTTGRVLQFDPGRGYGFVAADDGGEDVFLHASVFDGDLDELVPGTKMTFQIMAGDRGRKAFAAHLADDDPGPVPVPRPAPPAMASPAMASSAAPTAAPSVPAQDDEQMCDVLSQAELGQELTELLLAGVSTLTGQQIVEIRRAVLESARKHGWVDI